MNKNLFMYVVRNNSGDFDAYLDVPVFNADSGSWNGSVHAILKKGCFPSIEEKWNSLSEHGDMTGHYLTIDLSDDTFDKYIPLIGMTTGMLMILFAGLFIY